MHSFSLRLRGEGKVSWSPSGQCSGPGSITQDHRIAEVGRHLLRSSSPTLPVQGESSRAGCPGPAKLSYDCLQEWRLHNLSGQPAPMFGDLSGGEGGEVFSSVWVKFHMFLFATIAFHPVSWHH